MTRVVKAITRTKRAERNVRRCHAELARRIIRYVEIRFGPVKLREPNYHDVLKLNPSGEELACAALGIPLNTYKFRRKRTPRLDCFAPLSRHKPEPDPQSVRQMALAAGVNPASVPGTCKRHSLTSEQAIAHLVARHARLAARKPK